MHTREQLLEALVEIYKLGAHSHTDVVNCLGDLLDNETAASDGQEWVAKFREAEAEFT